MKIKKYLPVLGLAVIMGLGFSACSDDDFTETIFPDVSDDADPNASTYQFDTWLHQNFRDVYNMEFVYKMRDVETNYDYNLTPASIENSMKMAVLIKYVWYDAYAEAYGGSADNLDRGFLKAVGPKMIHLIGSGMYNTNGSETLGYATGGVKITLCDINNADFTNISQLNNRYFHTMHHEYCHILHQTKSYPTEFNYLSNGHYDSSNWQDRNGGICASLGLQTPYAGSSYTEDFAETVSGYLTRSDADWEMLYWCADRGWYSGDDETDLSTAYCYYYYMTETARSIDSRTYTLRFVSDAFCTNIRLYDVEENRYSTPEACEEYLAKLESKLRTNYCNEQAKDRYGTTYAKCTDDQKAVIDALADSMQFIFPVEDSDQVDGRAIMEQKINIARTWFKDSWGLDLDNLRTVVQRRSAEYNLDALLQEISDIPIPN